MRRIFLFVSLLLSVLSCSKQNTGPESQDLRKSTNPPVLERLDKNKKELSSEDAALLVKLYNSQSGTKSSTSDIEIKDIVPICAGDSVVMWAVNLSKGGYVICAANKSYYPIIADVQYGAYDPETIEDTALEFYLNKITEDAQHADVAGDDSEIGLLWHKYEDRDDVSLNTKSSMDYVDDYYYDYLYDNYYDSWVESGYNVYFLRQYPREMPIDLYQSFCSTAADVLADVPGYPYMDCCIILERTYSRSRTVGPLVQTHWNQNSPYNNSDEQRRPLGCVTVAVGQIMKYFEHPKKYSWGQMPNSLPSYTAGTTVLSDFLYQLRKDLLVTDSGGSDGLIAATYLFNNGYHTSYNRHNYANVTSALNKNYPVYMQGDIVGQNIGHAWVCDGYRSNSEYQVYKLMVPSIYSGQIEGFEPFGEDYNEPTYSSTDYHMNWGWGGLHDGYFKMPTPDNDDFSDDWRELIVSPK